MLERGVKVFPIENFLKNRYETISEVLYFTLSEVNVENTNHFGRKFKRGLSNMISSRTIAQP